MNHIAEVAQLKELEAKATNAPWTLMGKKDFQIIAENPDFYINFEDSDKDDPQLITDLRNAAPWLLAVAGQFQAGDAKKLEVLTRYLFSRSEDIEGIPMAYILTAVHRMLAAARAMEAEL